MMRSYMLGSRKAAMAAISVALFSSAIAVPAGAIEPVEGQLSNGLTYFIDPEPTPDRKISFRLLVRVGEWQTLPREQSVAHVVEHIVHASAHVAGSKGSLRSRLERLGGVWGSDTNAATTEYYTAYYVQLPAANPASLKTGFDILYDWMAPRILSDEEIEREIGAVIEERRRGSTEAAAARWETQNRIWFPGKKLYDYKRDAIGTLSATSGGIRDLHRLWYKPSNMAVIIRGTNSDHALAAVKERLGSIPRGEPAPASVDADLLPIEGGHYALLASDGPSESKIEMTFKYRPAGFGSIANVTEKAIGLIVDQAARRAVEGLLERYGGPIASLSLRTRSPYEYPALDMLTLVAIPAPGQTQEALTDLLRLARTLRTEGFSTADIERARQEVVASLKGADADASDRFESLYLRGQAEPAPRNILTAATGVAPAEVNAQLSLWLDPTHRDVFMFFPKTAAAGVPSVSQFDVMVAAAEREPPFILEAPANKKPNLTSPGVAGAMLTPPSRENAGYVRWQLPRSQATLLYRRAETDEFRIALLRYGGLSNTDPTNLAAAAMADAVVSRSGLAGLNGFELARFYSSEEISVEPNISVGREGLLAKAPADRSTALLDLVREQFLQPSCRADAFEDVKRERLDTDNVEADALDRADFAARVENLLGSPFAVTRDMLAAVEVADVCREYTRMLSDTSNMVIAIEGDLEAKALYQRVASRLDIPSRRANRQKSKIRTVLPTQAGRDIFLGRKGNAASVVMVTQWVADRDESAGALAASILDRRISARLRDVEKGTYAVSVGMTPGNQGSGARFSINFDTAPEFVERMIAAVTEELEIVRRDGVNPDELEAARALVREPPLSPQLAAEAWLMDGTLRARPPATDKAVRAWIERRIDPSRFHEFVRVPSNR